MMKLVLGTAFALFAAPLCAQTVIATLPDYNGASYSSGFPISIGTVGTFTYVVPVGSMVASAFLEGTYGTALVSSSTASYNASVDGTSITVCGAFAANCYVNGAALRPFSFALPASSYASLMDGSAALALTQTTDINVRFGSPTLRILFQTAVPEPATWAMMLLGFGAIGVQLRRRRPALAPQTA